MKSELLMITSKKSGFLKRNICFISFFKDEILVTSLDNKKQKELLMAKKDDIKVSGGGVIKQIFGMQTAITEYADLIKNMNKEDINKENTESIPKSSITKIKFKNASIQEDYENNTSSLKEGKLTIFVNNIKTKYKHKYEDKTKEIKNYINNYI